MKLLVVVALFAFVAVKLSQATPVPGDDKKDEVSTSSVAVPDVTAPAAAPVEVKTPLVKSESPVSVPPAAAAEKAEAPATTV